MHAHGQKPLPASAGIATLFRALKHEWRAGSNQNINAGIQVSKGYLAAAIHISTLTTNRLTVNYKWSDM